MKSVKFNVELELKYKISGKDDPLYMIEKGMPGKTRCDIWQRFGIVSRIETKKPFKAISGHGLAGCFACKTVYVVKCVRKR